jgi:hypothetical protein
MNGERGEQQAERHHIHPFSDERRADDKPTRNEANGRIRILAFFKFNSTIFPEKLLLVLFFPDPRIVSLKILPFERVGALPKHADTDDAHAFDLLTRCRAI